MKVYALWHGGTNYAHGYVDTDVEEFDTLADAVAAFRERLSSNMHSPVDFPYVNRPAERVCAGMVDESSSMWLWADDPTGVADPYPWRIVETGPRGGTRVVPA